MEAPRNHCHTCQAHAVSLFLFLFFFFNSFFYQLLVILKILIPANTQQCKSFYKDLVSGTLAYVYSWFLSNKVNLSHIFSNCSSSHTHRKKNLKGERILEKNPNPTKNPPKHHENHILLCLQRALQCSHDIPEWCCSFWESQTIQPGQLWPWQGSWASSKLLFSP